VARGADRRQDEVGNECEWPFFFFLFQEAWLCVEKELLVCQALVSSQSIKQRQRRRKKEKKTKDI
jgi:hypothetical protein